MYAKMSAKILIFVFIATSVAAELPSYIRVCGRKNPDYNQCIAENLNSVKDKVCEGFPEFNVSPGAPLTVKKAVIYDTKELKLYLQDVVITRFCDYVISSVHVDSDRLHFSFNVTFNNLTINALYNFDIHILVPVVHEGPVNIQANVSLQIDIDAKVVTKNNKKEIYAAKVKENIFNIDFEYTFLETGKELRQLHQVLTNVVDSSKKDVVRTIKPIIEQKFAQLVLLIFNGIARSNYEKLFPE
ncbi:uncharacterized protein LOC113003879 [Solenopsis invicta]|uniref:uncharacterized protein LOC113003879 n=1 Tax=Solenopsis invicta TaxID=13686 RepID=UPI00193E50FB|nr:uncharacterized protein LOC113003879 [Solenopsis invicta]